MLSFNRSDIYDDAEKREHKREKNEVGTKSILLSSVEKKNATDSEKSKRKK
jgi:hypothetical protein